MVAIVSELHVVIYISLIDGLCKMGEIDFSIEMQILMVEKGMAPDVFTYISLIQGLSDAALLDEALMRLCWTRLWRVLLLWKFCSENKVSILIIPDLEIEANMGSLDLVIFIMSKEPENVFVFFLGLVLVL